MEHKRSDEALDEVGGLRLGDIYIPPPPRPPRSLVADGPRLVITHIMCEDFKSFAGKQYLGPFSPGFTCVVGPNGSGKSNVFDCLRFVFGCRSSKIRSEKLSRLIHQCKTHQNIQSCSVAIHFSTVVGRNCDHDAGQDPKFCIGRTAFENNTSIYTLNNKKVQFREISNLLQSQGIDLDHSHFLIPQGEVEQIALIKEKASNDQEAGLIEYLEDIIGTSRFKEPIMLLEDRIKELREKKLEESNKLKSLHLEMEDIEKDKDAVILYLKLENEISKEKNKLFQKYLKDNKKLLSKKEQEKSEIQNNLEHILTEMKSTQEETKIISEKLEATKREIVGLEQEKENLNKKIKAHENEELHLQTLVDEIRTKGEEINLALTQEQRKLADYEAQLEKYASDLSHSESDADQLQTEFMLMEEQLQEAMLQIGKETADLCSEKDNALRQLAEQQKVVDEMKSQYEVLNSELQEHILPKKRETEKLQNMQKDLEKCKEILGREKKEQQEILERLPDIIQQLTQAKNAQEQLRHEEKLQLQELQNCRSKLHEANQFMRTSDSSNKVLNHLMKCKAQLPGLFGRLGDLGAIDVKYDVAISTACAFLDHIVVDTVKTAQKCIELLRESKVGQSSFIALEYQEKFRTACDSHLQTPENVKRLLDLIKLEDERLRVAFYFALRDTLVVDTLEQATRVSYSKQKRYRVVTLSGHIIETTGVMTGGGNTVKKGQMSNKIYSTICDKETVEQLGIIMQKHQRQLIKIREEIEIQNKKIPQCELEVKCMKTKLQKIKDTIKTSEERSSSLDEEIKKQEKVVLEVSPEPTTVSIISEKVKKANEAYSSESRIAEEIKLKVVSITTEIEKKINMKVGAAKKNLEACQMCMLKQQKEIKKTKDSIKVTIRDIGKCKQKIDELEKEVKETENTTQNCQKKKSVLQDITKKFADELNQLTKSIRVNKDAINLMNKQLEMKLESELKNQAKTQELESAIDIKNKTVREYKQISSRIIKEIKSLKVNKVPGDNGILYLPTLTDEEIDQLDMLKLQYSITVLEEKLPKEKPDFSALEQYLLKEKLVLKHLTKFQKIMYEERNTHFLYDEARKERIVEFMNGFNTISMRLKQLYTMITLGGDADLDIMNPLDPFSEGVIFSVRPPQKSWKNISNLSGGEKTLSSLALILAFHFYKPSPFIVLDEIDAALDYDNVTIVGNFLKNHTLNTQCIIISLKSNMFELSLRLLGVFKVDDCTKGVTINPYNYAVNPQYQGEVEEAIVYEVNQNDSKENVNGFPELSNTKQVYRRKMKIEKMEGEASPVFLQNVLQTAFTAMFKVVHESSPILQTREEIEECVRRVSGISTREDKKLREQLRSQFLVSFSNQTSIPNIVPKSA